MVGAVLCGNGDKTDRQKGAFIQGNKAQQSGMPDVSEVIYCSYSTWALPQAHLGKGCSDMSSHNPLCVAFFSHSQERLDTGHLSLPPTD